LTHVKARAASFGYVADMTDNAVTVDVCEDIRNGREPFSIIMTAVAQLADGQNLRLIAPFEPLPLFTVLAKKGFQHTSRQIEQGRWEVLFSQTKNPQPSNPAAPDVSRRAKQASDAPFQIVELDARGLEPPQPMVKILEALAALPEGGELRAHTDRRPIHLYSHLEERRFSGDSKEQNDGSFITHIRCR